VFQSRSGFSPYFGHRTPTARSYRERCFNPGLGFLPTSAGRRWLTVNRRTGFNPGLGFLPTSAFRVVSTLDAAVVSIPVWVFSLLRHRGYPRGALGPTVRFNPGLGFLPTSAEQSRERAFVLRVFQSRSGFSPYFGQTGIEAWWNSPRGFNPGLGFLPTSATHERGLLDERRSFNPGLGFLPTSARVRLLFCGRGSVSIPVWVFSLLRPLLRASNTNPSARFQSRSGFSPYFGHMVENLTDVVTLGFNPGLGFLPTSAGRDDRRKATGDRRFQSRSGFSPYFGGKAREWHHDRRHVSIPVWVFSLLRHLTRHCLAPAIRVSIPVWVFSLLRHQNRRGISRFVGFQSRSGFSPYFGTIAAPGTTSHLSCFNPGLGFLPTSAGPTRSRGRGSALCFNPGLGFLPTSARRAGAPLYRRPRVSIPVWVFSLLRRRSKKASTSRPTCFNPGLGFLPTSAARSSAASVRRCFNPGLGFLPTSANEQQEAIEWFKEFQSRSGFSPYFGAESAL